MTTDEHIRALREALEAARACILIDRESVAECHTAPDGMMDDDGEEALAELDAVLSQIEAAMPSLAALDEAKRDAGRWREVAKRFDSAKTSRSQLVLDGLGLSDADPTQPLSVAIDAALTPGA